MEVLDKKYPLDAKDYELYEEIGEGVSATVYKALCIPINEVVAIKVLDLERCNNDLDGIRREVHTMTLIDHPNVLRAHCSFTAGHSLWVVMPYMAGGSCQHIMKSSYPEGLEEPVIASLLRETLKALVYLHAHGHIHRDVKAGNILIDSSGKVKVADFGVSACMFDTGDRQRSRNTFVGTPCWMAPEVMQQLHGYDFKADIWSFGITALELAHGHAPFSKYPPMKVLLMTLQNAPPGLDYERDKRFSKSFSDLIAACLVKNPKKRPSSDKLIKFPFFKQAKSPEYLPRTILNGISPLGERFRMLKAKDADALRQNKALHGDKEQLSQEEYIRGISAWNFNLEDLRSQAAIIQDEDNNSATEINNLVDKIENMEADNNNSHTSDSHEDGFEDLDSLEGSLASFPIQPVETLKGYFDVGKNDSRSTSYRNVSHKDKEMQNDDNCYVEIIDGDNLVRGSSMPQFAMTGEKKVCSGPLFNDDAGSLRRHIGDRDNVQPRHPADRNHSDSILNHQKRDAVNNTWVEDSPGAVVQRRGRFQVTSAEANPKSSNCVIPGSTTGPSSPYLAASSILPSLQCILQQNNLQQDKIIKLLKQVEQGNLSESADAITNGNSQALPVSGRESELLAEVSRLQQRIGSLVEELQRQKSKNAQLERRVNALDKIDEQTER